MHCGVTNKLGSTTTPVLSIMGAMRDALGEKQTSLPDCDVLCEAVRFLRHNNVFSLLFWKT